MHVFFSGIGGVGIGPLALIAKQAGYDVSGSDIKQGKTTEYLISKGIEDIHYGQTGQQIASVHEKNPIDWFVYTSALPTDKMDHPELDFCKKNGIRASKRDEFIKAFINEKGLKMIAVAGTHGKTTTTAMMVWLLKQKGVKISYSIGAQIDFGDMGHYEDGSEYFVYECDEFDRNFLAYHPFFSVIPGVTWDHHEIYQTQESYNQAFRDFLNQSQRALLWEEDIKKLGISEQDEKYTIAKYEDQEIGNIKLSGLYNRRDAWLVVKAVSQIVGPRPDELFEPMNRFPGVSRRFEQIEDNLYSDDAHTPEKIMGCMSVAEETAKPGQKIVAIYEPLTNRRMHYLGKAHQSVFKGADVLYWLPSYLAREDSELPVLTPEELIKNLDAEIQKNARPMERGEKLRKAIEQHLQEDDLVVGIAGGGSGSLDEWLRDNFNKAKL